MKSLKEALNETRPWGQEPGAEWDEGPEDDIAQKKIDRKDRMAQWKSKRVYPAPGEQKPGFAKSPEGDLDEAEREPSSYDHDDREMSLDTKRSQAAGKARQDAKKSPYDHPGWESTEIDEMDASQPNAPTSMAGMDEICEECGKGGGQHALGCSRMNESDDDDGTNCPECGAPHGMKHDKGCPIGQDQDPAEHEHMGGIDRKRGDVDEADDDDDDMDTLGDEDACPGCGAKPGDGINPKCDDPMGCGFWKEFHASVDGPKGRSMRDMLKTPSADDDDHVRAGYGDREGFETKDGEWIENPFWDESGRDEVDPDAHYGDAFKKSGLAKRLRWGESSDYDGLPLTEGSMFDRFDTLVGHRFDGTFDERETEAAKLRALVKKVVREAWTTRDPDSGEETEHSMDDKDIEDLYVDKKDKKHEARGCVREGDIDEMKLSIAGPAFGAASSDTGDEEDDGDEDYKVLTPRKAPPPEPSGTHFKSTPKKPKKS